MGESNSGLMYQCLTTLHSGTTRRLDELVEMEIPQTVYSVSPSSSQVRCPDYLLSLLDWNAGDHAKRMSLIHNGDLENSEKQHQLEQLQEVREFCDNEMECRRQQILRHFGEQFDPQHCRKRCDVCLKDETMVEQDFTDAANNLLQIVSDLTMNGDTLSKTMLVDVYRGANKKEVKSKGLQNNSLFGIGKCYNKDLVTRIIDQLVKQGGLDWSFVRKDAWSVKYIIVSGELKVSDARG